MQGGGGGPDAHNPFEALLGQPFLGGGAPPMPDLTTLAASVEGECLRPHPPAAPAALLTGPWFLWSDPVRGFSIPMCVLLYTV